MCGGVTGTFVGLLLGVAMGARHALDPDHLAAVSVLAADAPSARRGALLGALWGVGHAAALLGTGLVLAALAAELPRGARRRLRARGRGDVDPARRAGRPARAARPRTTARRGCTRTPASPHRHAGPAGARAPGPTDVRAAAAGRRRRARPGRQRRADRAGARAAAVGAAPLRLHGAVQRGSILGMCALSGLAGWPLARLARHPRAARLLLGTAGAASAALGLLGAGRSRAACSSRARRGRRRIGNSVSQSMFHVRFCVVKADARPAPRVDSTP